MTVVRFIQHLLTLPRHAGPGRGAGRGPAGWLRFLPGALLAATLCCPPDLAADPWKPVPKHPPAELTAPLAAPVPAGDAATPAPTGTEPPAPPGTPAAPPEGAAPPAEPITAETIKKAVTEEVTALGKKAELTHDRLERGILQQVVRLDNFFGKANSQKEQHTSYLLRWRNALRYEQGGGLNFGSSLRAHLQLSRISERLKLSISGEDKPDTFAPSLPEDPGSPGFDRTLTTARIVNTELRYQIFSTPLSGLFLGTGVDLEWPLQVFARARYHRTQRITEHLLLRFAETLFAKTPYGLGETTELALERSLNPRTLVRWATSGTVSQEIDALEWGNELSLLHEISPKSAVTVLAGVYGNSAQDDWVNNYRLMVRYRRNFLRPWLYYELEPQVAWPLQADDRFKTTWAFTARLEIVFQGEEKNVPER